MGMFRTGGTPAERNPHFGVSLHGDGRDTSICSLQFGPGTTAQHRNIQVGGSLSLRAFSRQLVGRLAAAAYAVVTSTLQMESTIVVAALPSLDVDPTYRQISSPPNFVLSELEQVALDFRVA